MEGGCNISTDSYLSSAAETPPQSAPGALPSVESLSDSIDMQMLNKLDELAIDLDAYH